MTEHENGANNGEEIDFVAPETGDANPPPAEPRSPIEPYQANNQEGRDVVLRNAHAYLYDREQLDDKESPFRETRGEKAARTVKRYWNAFLGAAGKGFGKKWGDQDPSKHERTPLDRAFLEGIDEKKFEELKKTELAKGPEKADLQRLQQGAIFREAYAIREKAAQLIDERRRGADANRQAEIEAELNLAYLQIMILAHTRSFEAEVVSETQVKRGPVDRSIPRQANETEAQWRQRAQTTKQKVELKGLAGIFENGIPDLTGVPPTRADATEWHNAWSEKVLREETESGRAAGYDKLIKTEGALTRENLDNLAGARQQITSIADILRLVPPDVLEQRYGIRVSVQKPEQTKRIAFQVGKKNTVNRSVTRAREITVLLPDNTGGAFVHFAVEPRGFLKEKDGELEVASRPSSIDKLKEEEYLALSTSVIKHQGDASHPYPTLLYSNTDPAEILRGEALRQLEYQYARILTDFPDLNDRAEQAAERERREEEERIAAENSNQRQANAVDDD